ncbi:MAG TPA: hypothetical protein VMU08_13510, partial [Rhizomicrobium sp.]|nr:hypothetical protein [Rhizomicrobium sp.]
MHDIRAIRDNPEGFTAALKRRPGYGDSAHSVTADLLARDLALRELLTDLQVKQARRNEASKQIGQAKASLAAKQRGGAVSEADEDPVRDLMEEVSNLKDAIQAGEQKQRELEDDLK